MEHFVAFTDATEEVIGASFGCPQDDQVWPYQGIVSDTDSRWASYTARFPAATFDSSGA